MKKILIYMLLLANLFSGLAFAWDNDPVAMLGHEVESVDHVVSASLGHLNDGLSHDDHCSHGAAHVVGIFYNVCLKMAAAESGHHSMSVATLPFLYISPLHRPPIV